MKIDRNILIAFILNLSFSLLEIIGGFITNSISILSGAVHDLADAASIGTSYYLEKKSKHKPNYKYTYGYVRYSTLAAFITTIILLSGSLFVIYNAINRLFNPIDINYDGMIIIALIGILFNIIAVYKTKGGHSLNQEAVKPENITMKLFKIADTRPSLIVRNVMRLKAQDVLPDTIKTEDLKKIKIKVPHIEENFDFIHPEEAVEDFYNNISSKTERKKISFVDIVKKQKEDKKKDVHTIIREI